VRRYGKRRRASRPILTPDPSLTSRAWWKQDLGYRKVAAITGSVAAEQGQMPDGRMCTNVEVRQRRGPLAAATTIEQVALPSQKTSFPGKRFALIQSGRKGRIERFDGSVSVCVQRAVT
jgi:hypothetical protein